MNVCAYIRVSTSKEDQLNSFDNQHSYFNREVEAKGHNLVSIYADEGLSGTKLYTRPQFNQMLHDAGLDVIETKSKGKKHIYCQPSNREPLFDEIWIKNTSRFARQTMSFEIINKLRQKGVYIYFIEQNINTREIGQDLLLKLMQIFDEQESKDKSLKVKSGLLEGAKKNIIMTNGRIYGYNYIKHENRLEIIPEEAEVIRTIFDLYSSGHGIRRIISYLTENKILTRNGKVFTKSTISKILSNEKYMGINVREKYDSGRVIIGKHYPKVKDKSEWIIQENDRIPAIVSKELFSKCEALRSNKVNTKNQKGINKGQTEYAGLLFCGKCGSTYTSNVDSGRRFYNCSNKKLNGIKACNSKNVSKAELDEVINNYCTDFYKMIKSVKEATINRMNLVALNLINNLDNSKNEEISRVKQEIYDQEDIQNNLIELYSLSKTQSQKDKITKSVEVTESKIESLNTELRNLTKKNYEILANIAEAYNRINTIKKLEVKTNYSRVEMLDYIHKIEIWQHPDDGKVSFMFFNGITNFYDEYLETFGLNQKELYKFNTEETKELEAKYQSYFSDNVS